MVHPGFVSRRYNREGDLAALVLAQPYFGAAPPRKHSDLAEVLLYAGRFALATEAAERALELAPTYFAAHQTAIHGELLRGDEAAALVRITALTEVYDLPPFASVEA
jgi:hypothetical protein